MVNFSFETQGTNTYLVYEISKEDTIDTMSLGMLTNNDIPGLLPAIFTQMDSTCYIKYNVSAKISAKQLFEGQVNKKRLLGVFGGIVDAVLSAEDYMIDTSSILLDLDYIFADVSTCKSALICLPVISRESGTDLAVFFKRIMFSTQFDQTENCDHVAKIINYLNSTPAFSLAGFKSILDSLNGEVPVERKQDVIIAPVQQQVNSSMSQVCLQKNTVQQNSLQPVTPQDSVNTQRKENPPLSKDTNIAVSQFDVPRVPVVNKQKDHKNISPGQNIPQGQKAASDEKEPSFLWLMLHYSKENKAIYDANKASKKTGKNESLEKQSAVQPYTEFDVPGKQTDRVFDIPGQQPQNTNPQYESIQKLPQTSNRQEKQAMQRIQIQPPPRQESVQQVQKPPQISQYDQTVINNTSYNNFGETTILDGGIIGETTVLGVSSQQTKAHPYLVRIKNNERIEINKPVFRIGKEKSYVDYFISDNTAVSRSHANIICKENQYFVVDTNSTNHTYVNGGMIQSNVETNLSHGTKLRFANEEFEFRLY